MKAILHIGIEKTGTTTIQAFLDLNREKLANQGVAYLRSPGLRNNRKLATYCMDNNIIDGQIRKLGIVSKIKRDQWKAKFKQEFDLEIQNLEPKISTVLISSEQFHSRLRKLDEVKNLFKILKPYFEDIKVLVYLRRQDKVAVSLCSTKCKVGSTNSEIFDEKLSAKNPYYNYYELVEKWTSVFGESNIIIRIFEREKFIKSDLLQDFSDAIGLKNTESFHFPRYLNEKLSAQVQRVILLFNNYFPQLINNTSISFNNKLRSHLIQELNKKYKGNEMTPTIDQVMKFQQKFQESNKKLAIKYLSSDNLFSSDFSMYPNQGGIEAKNFSEEIVGDVFCSISKFLENFLVIPKSQINLDQAPGDILREIALGYERDYPEISLFLMQEAYKYQPTNSLVLEKINQLKSNYADK